MGVLGALGGLVAGIGLAWAWLRRREAAGVEAAPSDEESLILEMRSADPDLEVSEFPSLPGLVAAALREPLARLRRIEACPPDLRERLDRVAARLRLLDSRPRPMQSKSASPIALLQETAEEVDLLRARVVGITWSLQTQKPVLVDPDRIKVAFRELLDASAEAARPGGKLGIRVVPGSDPDYPVCIEVEVGRRFAQVDPLALVVVRHLLESQAARAEVDARMTRIALPGLERESPLIPEPGSLPPEG